MKTKTKTKHMKTKTKHMKTKTKILALIILTTLIYYVWNQIYTYKQIKKIKIEMWIIANNY